MTAFKTKKNKPQNIKISNDKIQQVKEYRSPKTYMKECIYEQPPIQKERKKKGGQTKSKRKSNLKLTKRNKKEWHNTASENDNNFN